MMDFDWIDYHNLANHLYDKSDVADIRSAISRDYYACHHLCKLYLIKNKGFKNNKDSKIHCQVNDFFRSSKNEKEHEIGEGLTKLRFQRNRADYNPSGKWSEYFIENKLSYKTISERIIKTLGELESN